MAASLGTTRFVNVLRALVLATLALSAPHVHVRADDGDRTPEYHALAFFYHSLGGDTWVMQTNWLTGRSPCDNASTALWFGVQCANSTSEDGPQHEDHVAGLSLSTNFVNGAFDVLGADFFANLSHVTSLDLGTNFLQGNIPTEIASWGPTIRTMNLEENALGRSIPTELGRLSQLGSLSLSFNDFDSPLPSEVCALSKLVSLEVSNCYLVGSLPECVLQNLPALESLIAARNRLGGSLPAFQVNNTLRIIELDYNGLTGPLPESLRFLTHVETFSATGNDLTGSLPTGFSSMSRLVSLSLMSNRIAGGLPDLALLTSLTVFLTNGNYITSTLPEALGSMQNMENFNVGNNYHTGTLPPSLGNWTNALYLGVGYNALMGNIPTSFGEMGALQMLDLSGNRLSQALPSECGAMTNLWDLVLSENSLSSRIPTQLALSSQLIYVYLSTNLFSGSLPTELGLLSRVEEFFTSSSALSGTVPTQLGEPTSTGLWKMDHTSISGSLPTEIARLSGMLAVDFQSARLEGSLPSEMFTLTTMSTLLLGGNSLSGRIDERIGEFENLAQLDLGENQLVGSLPSSIGVPSKLTMLRLLDNCLTGTIPWSSIGRLTALETLSLSQNSLSGAIVPGQLAKLTRLTTLALTLNRLQGEVPSDLGGLSALNLVALGSNQLHGSVPTQVCRLTALQILDIAANKLTQRLPGCLNASNLPKLEAVAAYSNKLTGRLPNLAGFEFLETVLLHENAFTGHLGSLDPQGGWFTHQRAASTRLQTLTMHINKLTGSIPTHMTFPASVRTLTLASNSITGRVSDSMLPVGLWSRGGNVSIDMFFQNNRLSCDLPWPTTKNSGFEATGRSLVAIGNWFSKPLSAWVSRNERRVSFMSVRTDPTKVEGGVWLLPTWVNMVWGCGVCFGFVVGVVLYLGQPSATARSNSTAQFIMRCAWWTAGLGIAYCMWMLPVIGTGATFYRCGDAFVKYTSLGFMDEPTPAWLAACGAACVSVGTVLVFWLLVPAGEPAQDAADRGSEYAPLSDDDDDDDDDDKLQPSGGRTLRPVFSVLLGLLLYTVALAVLSLPSVMYAISVSLPAQNTLGLHTAGSTSLHYVLALFLTLANLVLIPFFTSFVTPLFVRGIRDASALHAIVGPASARGISWTLSMLARTLVVVLVPVAAVVATSNECFGGWTHFWSKCYGSDRDAYDVSVTREYVSTMMVHVVGLTNDFSVTTGVPVTFSLFRSSLVCDPPPYSIGDGTCARSMLAVLEPIYMYKMFFGIAASAVAPLVMLMAPLVERVQERLGCGSALAPEPETVENVPRGPDPMFAFIYLETCVVLGPLMPVLLLLLPVQLAVDSAVLMWRLDRSPESPILPLQRWALIVLYVYLAALQYVMSVLFFEDTGQEGRVLVWVSLPVGMGALWCWVRLHHPTGRRAGESSGQARKPTCNEGTGAGTPLRTGTASAGLSLALLDDEDPFGTTSTHEEDGEVGDQKARACHSDDRTHTSSDEGDADPPPRSFSSEDKVGGTEGKSEEAPFLPEDISDGCEGEGAGTMNDEIEGRSDGDGEARCLPNTEATTPEKVSVQVA